MEIRRFTDNDLDAVTALVSRINPRDTDHLPCYDDTPDAIAHYLKNLSPAPTKGFLVAVENDRLIGVMGLEWDVDLGRAWVHGPTVEHAAWNMVADRLLESVVPLAPDAIEDFELSFDTRNRRGIEFATRHGYRLRKLGSAALELPRAKARVASATGVRELGPGDDEGVTALHDAAFPNTYYSAATLMEKSRGDDPFRTFITADAEGVTGFLTLEADPATDNGYIHFLAVAPRARRTGLARRLISVAIDSVLADPQFDKVHLTVEVTNQEAIGLYRSLGFTRARTLVGYRKLTPRPHLQESLV